MIHETLRERADRLRDELKPQELVLLMMLHQLAYAAPGIELSSLPGLLRRFADLYDAIQAAQDAGQLKDCEAEAIAFMQARKAGTN